MPRFENRRRVPQTPNACPSQTRAMDGAATAFAMQARSKNLERSPLTWVSDSCTSRLSPVFPVHVSFGLRPTRRASEIVSATSTTIKPKTTSGLSILAFLDNAIHAYTIHVSKAQ